MRYAARSFQCCRQRECAGRVTAATCWGRDAADAVEFFVSRTPGLSVSDATRVSMTDVLVAHETPEGVLMRAGVWVVSARRPV
ncbi:hypothetical protein GCM10010207_59140 [Streptomyces atratus]|nr:hypothetical protein GCM10010207_59140 [Streptomyces atratus]